MVDYGLSTEDHPEYWEGKEPAEEAKGKWSLSGEILKITVKEIIRHFFVFASYC